MYFQQYLMEAAEALKYHLAAFSSNEKNPNRRILHLVICWESCDLDSVASALALAYIYSVRRKQHDYVPVINSPRNLFRLKTTAKHMLQKCDITSEILVFLDDLPETLPPEIRVILVDHHSSQFAANVCEVIDHKSLEKSSVLNSVPGECWATIAPEVGSCATLVAELYYADSEPRSHNVTQLLHAAIILDTINFLASEKRYCERDLAMADKLEMTLHAEQRKDTSFFRNILLEELMDVRADVSNLTLIEVLQTNVSFLKSKDLIIKVVKLPMTVLSFIQKYDVENAIERFASDCPLLVLLGMSMPTGHKKYISRDIGLISMTKHDALLEHIRHFLVHKRQPSFELRPHNFAVTFMGGLFLSQRNEVITRTDMMNTLQAAVKKWDSLHEPIPVVDYYIESIKPKRCF